MISQNMPMKKSESIKQRFLLNVTIMVLKKLIFTVLFSRNVAELHSGYEDKKASALAEASPLPLTRLDFGCIIKKNSECGDKERN